MYAAPPSADLPPRQLPVQHSMKGFVWAQGGEGVRECGVGS